MKGGRSSRRPKTLAHKNKNFWNRGKKMFKTLRVGQRTLIHHQHHHHLSHEHQQHQEMISPSKNKSNVELSTTFYAAETALLC